MLDMDKYYKNKMPLIIGWATAQVFTLQVNKEIKTPLLFLHGLTSGGKPHYQMLYWQCMGLICLERIRITLGCRYLPTPQQKGQAD